MRDQDFIGRDFIETRQRADGLSGAVHEGLRFQQPDFLAGDLRFGSERMVFRLARQRAARRIARELVDQPEAGVMAGLFVFLAGIAEADDEAYGHGVVKIGKPDYRGCKALVSVCIIKNPPQGRVFQLPGKAGN